jgi:hypothetical protein
MRRSISASIRAQVARRAHHRCEYCFSPLSHSPDPFAVDHIEAIARGGSDDSENYALACFGCNGAKSDIAEVQDPETGILVLLYNPRRDRWQEHFHWSDDFMQIIGDTPTGRATVLRLDLNRAGVVNLRRVLGEDEGHPPSYTL